MQYEQIRQTSSDPEIINRGRELAEEERPKKRARADRPDPETFGVRSSSDRTNESQRADTEI